MHTRRSWVPRRMDDALMAIGHIPFVALLSCQGKHSPQVSSSFIPTV